MSEANKGENNPMYGRTGEYHPRGMFGKSQSAETLISALIGTAIFVYNTDGTLADSFTSARKAALDFKVDKNTILRYVKNGNLETNGSYLCS